MTFIPQPPKTMAEALERGLNHIAREQFNLDLGLARKIEIMEYHMREYLETQHSIYFVKTRDENSETVWKAVIKPPTEPMGNG
jgi:hypothetical protein